MITNEVANEVIKENLLNYNSVNYQQLNNYITKKSSGTVRDLLSANLYSQAKSIILISTCCFRAKWKIGFDPKLTSNHEFSMVVLNVKY